MSPGLVDVRFRIFDGGNAVWVWNAVIVKLGLMGVGGLVVEAVVVSDLGVLVFENG